ncbi:hypothetical protein SPRG_02161 [Saprolegnia parasitica CBS 223.65]|uniref:Interferon-related developmental regulator N-terminal domain-containing protein n=1 Tax=Saprolegnia parasitica (strain CBS 223.65) TaxID=695850 RepID=A0A067CRM5_SAPPC|nr:hypothetical protein SPRG_02161 [Saprolegnia parasitica CBS 223.65]KDO33354.1 hypothetical protein SPRG_02161 [Saprolegnia parasitica CBS 223.65]|eukprot:XP_012196102.1 hypothetical protein SPRG_02161 [Saprolegnia parasitica CBS 223.65]
MGKSGKKHHGASRFDAHHRRRLSEEGKRLLRHAFAHDGDEEDVRSVEAVSNLTNRDAESSESELDGFDEWKGGHGKSKDAKEALHDLVEELEEKRDETRVAALEKLNVLLCASALTQEVGSIKSRLVTAALACLKKRHPESAVLCLRFLALVSITLGSDEEAYYNGVLQPLRRTVTDKCDTELRVEAVYALSISVFMCTNEDQPKWEVLELLGSILTGRHVEKDDNDSIGSEDDQRDESDDGLNDDPTLKVAAIECWAFLLSCFNPSQIVPMIYDQSSIIADHIVALVNMVQAGEDTTVRAMACEALALVIEYKYAIAQSSWSYDQESSSSPISGLIPKIQSFMKESGKTIGKKNRKTQRSTFKEVLETLETGMGPQERDMHVEDELIEINTWGRLFQADVLRRELATGFQVHLMQNDVLREIFQVRGHGQAKYNMMSTADKRAGHKTKARSLRASIAMRRRAQNSFLYTE